MNRITVWLLESRISIRQEFEKGQTKWFMYWMGYALVVFLIPWTQTNLPLVWIILAVIAVVGSSRYRHGPGYTYLIELRDTRKEIAKRERPNRKRRVMKREPIVARIMGFPTRPSEVEEEGARETASMEDFDESDLGVTYFPPRDSDSSMILTKGWDGANLDVEDLFDATNRLSNGLLEAARRSPFTIGITEGAMIRPYNFERMRSWQLANNHPLIEAAYPGTTMEEVRAGKSPAAIIEDARRPLDRPMTADELMNLDSEQREVMLHHTAVDPFYFYSLNVPRPTWWPKGDRGDIGGLLDSEDLYDAPIVELTRLVEGNLITNGVKGVKALNPDELINHTRVAWDLKEIEAWHSGAEFDSKGVRIDPDWPWPSTEYLVRKDKDKEYIDFDGSHHRVFSLERLDKKRVAPRQLSGLFSPGFLGPAGEVGLVVATSGDTLLSSKESNRTTKRIRLRKAFQRYRQGAGTFDVSSLEQEEARLLENRRDALDYGGSHALSFNTFIITSAASETHEATLKRHAKVDEIVLNQVRLMDMVMKPLPLASRQVRAFFTATQGASMM